MTDENLNKPLTNYGIQGYSWAAQALIWMGVFTGCFILAQLVGGGIVSYYKSVDVKQIASNATDLNVLRWSQMLTTIVGFLLPALIFSKLKDHPLLKYSNADRGFHPALFILVPLLIVTIYPMINASFFLNKYLPWNNWMKGSQEEYKIIVDALLKDKSVAVFILNFFAVAIVPAICEEWIFRGTLQKFLSEKINIHLAVFFASVFFGLIHFEFSGFPRIILGMFLGYLFYYSGSLWVNIFAHLVNNGAQITVMYLHEMGKYSGDVDNPEMPAWWELILYTVVFAGLWYLFVFFARKKRVPLAGSNL